MGANKEKQNLRFKKTSERLHKKIRYDGFTDEEKKIIKTKEKLDQFEKDLNKFWSRAPRKDNKSVDWDNLNKSDLDYFDYIFKQHEKLTSKLSCYEEQGFNLDDLMHRFTMLNCKSVSF